MFDITDPYNYTILGQYEEELEDRIDLLRKQSRVEPVKREEVDSLLSEYNVSFGELPTWIRWKCGEINVCD